MIRYSEHDLLTRVNDKLAPEPLAEDSNPIRATQRGCPVVTPSAARKMALMASNAQTRKLLKRKDLI